MNRRTVLQLLPVVATGLGGCLGAETSGGFSSGANQSGDGPTPTPTVEPAVQELRANLEERGVDVLGVSTESGTIVIGIQTSGDAEEDIRRAAGAYATVAGALDRDLRVRVEDRGLVERTFQIKLEWARRFVDDRMADQEYFDRINGTRSAR